MCYRLKGKQKLIQPCGPKNTYFLRMLSFYVCVAIVWSILFAFLKNEVLPGGKLLTLILLLTAAYTVGDVCKYIGIPKILGMLLSGILFRNSGYFLNGTEADVYSELISTTR